MNPVKNYKDMATTELLEMAASLESLKKNPVVKEMLKTIKKEVKRRSAAS